MASNRSRIEKLERKAGTGLPKKITIEITPDGGRWFDGDREITEAEKVKVAEAATEFNVTAGAGWVE